MLTIFSSPKPFQGHIDLIQRNAIGSWLALGSEVEVILIGDEVGLAETAAELGVRHISQIVRNDLGTPLLNSIFSSAEMYAQSPYLCYVNADILFMDDLLPAVNQVSGQLSQFLLIGRRWDLDLRTALEFGDGWPETMRLRIDEEGELHPPAGSDYFVYPKGLFGDLPPFALGRAGWDNWMIYSARARGIPVVDGSRSITIVHQNHSYDHLPDSKPHYRLPETNRNVVLAGGKETIFTLLDANWVLDENGIHRRPFLDRLRPRAVEASLIARFGPGKISKVFAVVFHPMEQIRYLFGKLQKKIAPDVVPENQGKAR